MSINKCLQLLLEDWKQRAGYTELKLKQER